MPGSSGVRAPVSSFWFFKEMLLIVPTFGKLARQMKRVFSEITREGGPFSWQYVTLFFAPAFCFAKCDLEGT